MAEKTYHSRSSFAQGFAVVQDENLKYGYINEQGEEVIACQFDTAQDFLPNGFAIVSQAWQYGTIDRAGKEVLPCKHEQLVAEEGSPYLLFTQNARQGLVDFQGQIALPAEYSSLNLAYEKTHYIFQKEDKIGAFIIASKSVIPAEYDYLVQIDKTRFMAQKAGKYGLIDFQNKVVLPIQYDDIQGGVRYAIAKQGTRASVFTKDLTLAFELTSEGIAECNIGEKSVFSVYQGEGKVGIVDEAGKVLVPFEYEGAQAYTPDFVLVSKAGCVWVVNLKNQKNSPTDYAQVYYYTPDAALFFPDDYETFGIMDSACKALHEPIFSDHAFFGTPEEGNYDKYIYIKQKDTQLWGIYGFAQRDFVVPCEYDTLKYGEGFQCHHAQKAGKWGIISVDFQETIPCLYTEKLAEGVFKGFIAKNEEGKKGVIDAQGQVIFPFEYAEVYFEAPDTFTGTNPESSQAPEHGYGEQAPLITIIQDEMTGKYGFQNPLDPSPVVCEYDNITEAYYNVQIHKDTEFDAARYTGYHIYKEDKIGYADGAGKVIIPPEYAHIDEVLFPLYYMGRKEEHNHDKGVYALINQHGEPITDFKYTGFQIKPENPSIILATTFDEKEVCLSYTVLGENGTQLSPTAYSYLDFMYNPNFLKYALEPFEMFSTPTHFGIMTTDFEVLTACIFKDIATSMTELDLIFVYVTGEEGRQGIFDFNHKKLVIPCEYYSVNYFEYGFIVQTEKGLGVIDNAHFELIIPCAYMQLHLLTKNYINVQGYFIAQNYDFKVGVINTKNEAVVPFDYHAINPEMNPETGAFTAEIHSFWSEKGALLPAVAELLSKQHELVTFVEGYAKISEVKGDTLYYGFVNAKFEIVAPCEYPQANNFSEGLAWVQKDELWGAIDGQNKVVIPFEYYASGTESDFKAGFAKVVSANNSREQIIDQKNKHYLPTDIPIGSVVYLEGGWCHYWIEEPEAQRCVMHGLQNANTYTLPTMYPIALGEGYLFYQDENESEKYHCATFEGKKVFELAGYSSIVRAFRGGVAVAYLYDPTKNDLISTQGKVLTEGAGFTDLAYLAGDLYRYRKGDHYLGGADAEVLEYNAEGIQRFWRDDLLGVINAKGEVVIPHEYERIELWSDTHLFLRKVGEEGEYGRDYFYDIAQKALHKMPDISDIQTQIAQTPLVLIWEFTDETRQKWLYGYADMAGKVVIPCTYEDAHPFCFGLASVKKGGKYGFINTKAEAVTPFEFDTVQAFDGHFAKGIKYAYHSLSLD